MNISLPKNNKINIKLIYKIILVTSFVAVLITLFFTKYKTYAPEIEIKIKWNNLNKTGKMMFLSRVFWLSNLKPSGLIFVTFDWLKFF